MVKPVADEVVVLPFPQTNLQAGKRRRPALVVANLTGDDLILCQISTQAHSDAYSVPLVATDVSGWAPPVVAHYTVRRGLFDRPHPDLSHHRRSSREPALQDC